MEKKDTLKFNDCLTLTILPTLDFNEDEIQLDFTIHTKTKIQREDDQAANSMAQKLSIDELAIQIKDQLTSMVLDFEFMRDIYLDGYLDGVKGLNAYPTHRGSYIHKRARQEW